MHLECQLNSGECQEYPGYICKVRAKISIQPSETSTETAIIRARPRVLRHNSYGQVAGGHGIRMAVSIVEGRRKQMTDFADGQAICET